MLFTIQGYLQDYLSKRNLADSDGYAVQLANLYFYHRSSMDDVQFLRRVRRIRTVLFVNNGIGNRVEFERTLVRWLDGRFKKNWKHIIRHFLGAQRQREEDCNVYQG